MRLVGLCRSCLLSFFFLLCVHCDDLFESSDALIFGLIFYFGNDRWLEFFACLWKSLVGKCAVGSVVSRANTCRPMPAHCSSCPPSTFLSRIDFASA